MHNVDHESTRKAIMSRNGVRERLDGGNKRADDRNGVRGTSRMGRGDIHAGFPGADMRYYDFYDSPYGQMLLVARDAGLCGVYFSGQKYVPAIAAAWRRDASHATLGQAKRELAEYFAGERKCFDVMLAPEGGPFQRSVWQAISGVGFGTTITYSELASRVGCPGSARAAGTATGRNPISIIVPCHRIIGSNGSLTGYAGGLERKRALLAFESGSPAILRESGQR